jgi:uncharacterized protein YbjT (DUF2867 family)
MKTAKLETILVTGATGNVGSEVIKQLSKATTDVNIKAAVHSVENVKKVVKDDDRVEVVVIDYNEPETLKEALKDVDKLFFVTPESPNASELASNLVAEAKNAGIRHIVKLSTIGADTEAPVASFRLHRQAEKMIEESGIPYTFLRPHGFMQNFINWYSPTIKSSNAFYPPAGDVKSSDVDVRDVAAVAIQALINNNDGRHNGKAYDITGPEAISYEDAARILSEQVGKKISYVSVSEEEHRRAMKDLGIGDWWINGILEVIEWYRKGYGSEVSSAVEEVTGKKPISFSQFVKDYAEAFR